MASRGCSTPQFQRRGTEHGCGVQEGGGKDGKVARWEDLLTVFDPCGRGQPEMDLFEL